MAPHLSVVALACVLLTVACGPKQQPEAAGPLPASPLPTAGIAGQDVSVYPLTLLSADETLGWGTQLVPHRVALERADSIIAALLTERSPEVLWVLPPTLRHAFARAPGTLADPDRIGTALLRAPKLETIPDPLRSQMRNLTAVAGGGRYAFVPASLVYVRTPEGKARAELTVVLADVRTGLIGWRAVANAEGADPWSALVAAFKTLTPGLP
jgi:hypothetical protein